MEFGGKIKTYKERIPALIVSVIVWLLGIISGNFFIIKPLISILFVVFLTLIFFLIKRKTLLLILIIFFAGNFRFQLKKDLSDNHISHLLEQQSSIIQQIDGKIISEVRKTEKGFSSILQIEKIANYRVQGRISFFTTDSLLQYGDKISFLGEIKSFNKLGNPLGFDYEEFMEAKNVFGSVFPISIISINENRANLFKKSLFRLKKIIRNRIETRFPQNEAFTKAIILGEKNDLGEQKEIFIKAGLSHLLAVSGLHVGILSLIIFSLLKLFFPQRNICRILLMLILIFYGFLCNWSPSVSRAVIMISIYLILKILQRKPNANIVLAISALIITAINPLQLFSVGFQLSFMAVFVILNIIPQMNFITFDPEKIEIMNLGKRTFNSILQLFSVSFIITIFLAPITLFYFNQFTLNGMIGNLVCIPLMGLILPLSILIISLPEIPLLIDIYSKSYFGLMLIFKKVSSFSAELPFYWNHISLSILSNFLLLLLIFSVYFLLKKRKLKWVIGFIFLAILFGFSQWNFQETDLLKITFFYCGLGDLCLIETPTNEKIMIDTGPIKSSNGHFLRSALPYFQKSGIKKLDWLVITHAHNDHYGGMEEVFKTLEVKNLIVTDEFQKRKIWAYFDQKIQDEPCNIYTVSDTSSINFGEIKCKIIHPDKNYADKNINNMSIVIRLDYKDFSTLFTGDLEEEGEHYLLEHYPEFLDVDCLKVGHHGSKTSSSNSFLRAVSPDYAFISTSLDNRFNFPHPTTIEKYSELGENYFISGKDGALQILTNGKNAILKTMITHKNIIDNEL